MLIHGASTRKQDGQQLFLPFEHPSIHKYRASLHFKLVSFDEGANMLMLKMDFDYSESKCEIRHTMRISTL